MLPVFRVEPAQAKPIKNFHHLIRVTNQLLELDVPEVHAPGGNGEQYIGLHVRKAPAAAVVHSVTVMMTR